MDGNTYYITDTDDNVTEALKAGHYNNSLVTMYRDGLGDFKYSCNFKLKYDIVRRLKMIFEQLEKLR